MKLHHLGVLLFLAPAMAIAQSPPVDRNTSARGFYLINPATGDVIDSSTGLPTQQVTVPATSTPLIATITSSACVLTSGASQLGGATAACSFASGVGKVGGFVPQLGRAIRVVTSQATAFTGTWYFGTSTDGCTTVNRLTSDDTLKADWTGQVNDYVDVLPTTGGVVGCIVATITSGTLSVAVRQ